MTRPRWSIVIPAYNEAVRLPRHLEDVAGYLATRGERHEIVVVDDGSSDGTAAAAGAAGRAWPAVRVLSLGRNAGKGAAVRAGMLAATGERRLFTDADGATPIRELPRLEAALDAGADVAIGSRALPDPCVVVMARPHRVIAGRLFNWMTARLGLPDVADSQCGFKAFTAEAADELFPRLTTRGFGFDVELLLLARRAGYRVAEVAVNWADQAGSKVGVLRHGPGMLWQIARARRRLASLEARLARR